LQGWWGRNKERRFKMEPNFEQCASADGWQVSNLPILSLAPYLHQQNYLMKSEWINNEKKPHNFLSQIHSARNRSRSKEISEIITLQIKKRRGVPIVSVFSWKGQLI
jgi:hypothetical protein